MTKKTKQTNFTLGVEEHDAWEYAANDLIQKKVFRSKVDAFETYIRFLHLSTYDAIKEFKASVVIK